MTMGEDADTGRQIIGPSTSRHYQRSSIERWCAGLRKHVQKPPEGYESHKPTKKIMSIDKQVNDAIENWAQQATPTFLWIQAKVPTRPPPPWQPSQIYTIAQSVAEGMGVKEYNVSPPGTGVKTSDGYEEAYLVYILYRMIDDMVKLLPYEFETKIILDPADFEVPTDSRQRIVCALATLEKVLEVLTCSGQSFVAIVHGEEILEDTEGRNCPHIKALVDILRKQGTKGRVKVLFVTEGPSAALEATLTEPGEKIDTSETPVERIPSFQRQAKIENYDRVSLGKLTEELNRIKPTK